jgi:hypothetical protein
LSGSDRKRVATINLKNVWLSHDKKPNNSCPWNTCNYTAIILSNKLMTGQLSLPVSPRIIYSACGIGLPIEWVRIEKGWEGMGLTLRGVTLMPD